MGKGDFSRGFKLWLHPAPTAGGVKHSLISDSGHSRTLQNSHVQHSTEEQNTNEQVQGAKKEAGESVIPFRGDGKDLAYLLSGHALCKEMRKG